MEGDVGVLGCVFGEGFEGDGLHVDFGRCFGFGLGGAFLSGCFFFFGISKSEEVVLGGVGLFFF